MRHRKRDGAMLARLALTKIFKVYSFRRGAPVEDISGLDPMSESTEEAGWGGLTEFSGRVGAVIAKVARRADNERGA